MTTSRNGAVIDALVTQFTADLTSVTVTDGLPITLSQGEFLMVGVEDPDTQGAQQSASFTQEWIGLGAKVRQEEGDITCLAQSWNGNGTGTGQKQARDAVNTILADLETSLVTDPTLGGVVSSGWLLMNSGQLHQDQTSEGAIAWTVFHVHYRARI